MNGSRTRMSRCLFVVAVVIVCASRIALADTQNVVFTIDPTVSTLNVTTAGGSYGAFVPSYPGSNTSFVDGHFLVAFDTSTDTPTSIQFIGGDGYYEQQSPLTLQTVRPGMVATWRDLSWDFNSQTPINGAGGVFTATTTNFTTWSGNVTEYYPVGNPAVFDDSHLTEKVTTGNWMLKETTPGSGDWTLSVSGTYVSPDGVGGSTETFALNATSTAHFGATNVTAVAPTDTHADVLGGATTPGGVSIDLNGTTTGGTFTAQQIPNLTGLSEQAVTAAAANPVFAASTQDLSTNPQIWTVDYTGLPSGQSATLVFHYDPSQLPAGTDESKLGIWHFDKTDNAWEFGGTVDTTNHTITFVTTSFSPFELGTTAVPEPSTLVLAGAGLLVFALRRRRSLR